MSDVQKPVKPPKLADYFAEQRRLELEAAAQKAVADAPAQAALQAEAEQLKAVGARPGLGMLFRPKEPPAPLADAPATE